MRLEVAPRIPLGGVPQPNPFHLLPLLEVVCGVNLIQLKRWYGRRVPHFRRLSLKSKVTQKLVNACRLTLQCPAAGEKKGVNGSQAGGKLSFYCLWRVLNFRWHCTLTHEANCLTARGAVYVCTRVLLMEIGQIIKCGSSLEIETLLQLLMDTFQFPRLWGFFRSCKCANYVPKGAICLQ